MQDDVDGGSVPQIVYSIFPALYTLDIEDLIWII